MLLEYVFRAPNRLGLIHVHALVPYRLRLLPHTFEAPQLAFYASGKCASADCGGEYGNDASGMRVRWCHARAELSAEERGGRADFLKHGIHGAMVAGIVFLWGCVCGSA